MAVQSNIQQINDYLNKVADCLDFTRPGIEGSVGKDIVANQAVRIEVRASNESGPDGPWEANRGEYGEAKREDNLPVGVGFPDPDDADAEGRMLSLNQLKGQPVILPKSANMIYGKSTFARNKAQWFTNGTEGSEGDPSGAENQPERHFFEFTDADANGVRDDSVEAIGRFLRTL